jgi:hypothetical protein
MTPGGRRRRKPAHDSTGRPANSGLLAHQLGDGSCRCSPSPEDTRLATIGTAANGTAPDWRWWKCPLWSRGIAVLIVQVGAKVTEVAAPAVAASHARCRFGFQVWSTPRQAISATPSSLTNSWKCKGGRVDAGWVTSVTQ